MYGMLLHYTLMISKEPMSRQDRYSPEFSTELPEMTTGGNENEWTTDEYWTGR